jgi:catechol 2,3-dioxygenase-like lactoylglutathione lyase family enzyme
MAGRVVGLWHTAVVVRDMDEALAFYRDLLGLEVESESVVPRSVAEPVVGVPVEEIRSVFLRFPGTDVRLEVHDYRGLERYPAACRPCDYGSGHFCVYVDDVDALYARLIEAGHRTRGPVVTVQEGHNAGAKVVYAISPDGYHLELFQPPPA